MIPDSPAVLDHGAIAATLGCIVAACHLTGWRALAAGTLRRIAAVARRAARPLCLFAPHTGRHRDRLHMTSAPNWKPAQAPRPGDPPRSQHGEVRAGATDAPAPGAAPGQAPDAATPAPPGEAATLPQPHAVPPSAGLGQHPFDAPLPATLGQGSHPTVADIFWPMPGQPRGQDPYAALDPDAPRLVLAAPIETTRLYDELIAVTDGTGPRAVIWPQAAPSTRTTGMMAALDDLPPVSVRRCSTDVAAFGNDVIRALRML